MMNNYIHLPAYQKLLSESCSLDLPFEKLQNKKILVTGAYGLIGSYLVDVLMALKSIDVYALGRNEKKMQERFSYYQDNKNFHSIIQDITKPLNTDVSFDYIIHTASSASPKLYSMAPVDVMNANYLGMLQILEYARKTGCMRIYYVSSSEVYGSGATDCVHEDAKAIISLNSVRNCYPDSKRATETLCQSYIRQYGLDIVIGRPAHIYGPTYTKTDDKAIAQFLNKALAHENIILKSTGMQKRSYCHVADTVNAILYQLLMGKCAEAYNIANNNCYITIAQLAQKIADIVGVKVQYEIPDDIEKAGYTPVLETFMSTEKLESLGWKPKYDLDTGIKNTLDIRRGING